MTRERGFTMVELITVMILIGVIAAIGVPRLMGDNTTDAALFGDQVASGLRLAQKSAIARRRTVCVGTTATALTLTIQTAPGNANTCNRPLNGGDTPAIAATTAGVTMTNAPATMLFRPDGTIDNNSGGRFGALAIRIQAGSTVLRTISLDGGTGYVD